MQINHLLDTKHFGFQLFVSFEFKDNYIIAK